MFSELSGRGRRRFIWPVPIRLKNTIYTKMNIMVRRSRQSGVADRHIHIFWMRNWTKRKVFRQIENAIGSYV